ncbi:imidazole glycerol phosphate synthase subunit HisF [Candidatus Woesearchaeota archaeon]|nr:imidazole glycerol phosphate synthase subunit HisF [Candidatus Woesearchaeota archaeon]
MFRPRIIPCLLLKGAGLVKTIKFGEPKYIGDPMNAVKIFNDLKADELVFLDIDASKESRTVSFELVKKIGDEAFMPFSVGGGIKNTEDIKKLFSAGVEKVVINTGALENDGLIKKGADIFGSQSIIASIDAKKDANGDYSVFSHGGTKDTGLEPVYAAIKMEKLGAGEILTAAVKIPVIAIGGAGGLNDFALAIYKGRASAVAAGSMFVYSGKNRGILINYPDREELEEIFKDKKLKKIC